MIQSETDKAFEKSKESLTKEEQVKEEQKQEVDKNIDVPVFGEDLEMPAYLRNRTTDN